MKDSLDPEETLRFMEPVIRRAGAAVMSYFRKDFVIERKNETTSFIDIVTEADRASEDIILDAIADRFPGHDVVSEERPPEITGSRWRWLVDPLDGTVNFAHGYPVFSVSIALMEDMKLVTGMVYDPLRNELFQAIRGNGAFLNGNPIKVSSVDRLDRSLVATGFPYDRALSPDNNVAEFSKVVTRVQGLRRGGSAAIDLAHVACGSLDGFWELKLKPWDMGAGMLLIQEAGGRVSDGAGNPTDVYTYCVVASNVLIHDQLVQILGRSC